MSHTVIITPRLINPDTVYQPPVAGRDLLTPRDHPVSVIYYKSVQAAAPSPRNFAGVTPAWIPV
ncbi:MAG: hypothetical protein ACRDRG_02810 [Pseudonocardiaceae bacterium]